MCRRLNGRRWSDSDDFYHPEGGTDDAGETAMHYFLTPKG